MSCYNEMGNGMPQIAWGAKVSPAFKKKVIDICEKLDCNPDYLMAAIALESGETFSPKTKNHFSGGTGLIQFMPSTAQGLGTSIADLEAMTAVEQLDWVFKYLQSQKGKFKTVADLYMTIVWPPAVGKPDDTPIFKKGSLQYEQAAGLDCDGDGTVTKAEAAVLVEARLHKGLRPGYLG
ncbi:MAG: transglycosylase SLT domain-containing protein [Alphaproteobacteria bacterium]|nr:transglycosylase SLT domain-containing protein [Alphaproteobacteria bacterium]MBV8413327.1 transglycosylase SLT domain-containing protein [Alphaproteobacteria bacterium]